MIKQCNVCGFLKKHKAKGMCITCYSHQHNKKYVLENKEYYEQYQKKYMHLPENKEKHNKRSKKYANKNPKKIKAQNYANKHNQRKEYCELCNLYKIIGNQYGIYVEPFLGDELRLEFHHTDYIKNEGFTVCLKHHNEVRNQSKMEA